MEVSGNIKINESLDFEVRDDLELFTIMVYFDGHDSSQYDYYEDVDLFKYSLLGDSTSGVVEIDLTARNKANPSGRQASSPATLLAEIGLFLTHRQKYNYLIGNLDREVNAALENLELNRTFLQSCLLAFPSIDEEQKYHLVIEVLQRARRQVRVSAGSD